MSKRTMSLQDACDLVPDDLPDGAYWAMAHELAGADYGEVWDELVSSPTHKPFKPNTPKAIKKLSCPQCKRLFGNESMLKQHESSMVRNGTHKRLLTAPQGI